MFKKVQISFVFVSILLVSVVFAQGDNTVEIGRSEQTLKNINSSIRHIQEKNERFLDTLQQKTDIEIEQIHTEAYRERKELLEQVYDAKRDMLESRENLLLSSQNSFDETMGIFNTAVVILGIVCTIVIALASIILGLGYFDREKMKKLVGKAKEGSDEIEAIRKGLEEEKQGRSEKVLKGALVGPNKEPTQEGKEAIENFVRVGEMADLFGVKSETKETLHAHAIELYYKKKYKEALDVLEELLKQYPDYAEAWYNKGVVLGKLGDLEEDRSEKKRIYEEALKVFGKAIRLNRNDAVAWYNKGLTLAKLGDLEEADVNRKKRYKKAQEAFYMSTILNTKQNLNRNNAEVWYTGGLVFTKLGEVEEEDAKKKEMYEKAQGAFDEAIGIKSDYAEAWYGKGCVFLRLGNLEQDNAKKKKMYEEVLKACDEVITLNLKQNLNRNNADVWYNKACAYALMGKREDALKFLEQAIGLDKKNIKMAREDKDFKSLLDDKKFKNLTKDNQ